MFSLYVFAVVAKVLVRKTSVGFSSASVAAAQLLGSELSEGSMVEVQAPPPIHRK
jgi:hypothetical protein